MEATARDAMTMDQGVMDTLAMDPATHGTATAPSPLFGERPLPPIPAGLIAAIADAAEDSEEVVGLCAAATVAKGHGFDYLLALVGAVAERKGWDIRLSFH